MFYEISEAAAVRRRWLSFQRHYGANIRSPFEDEHCLPVLVIGCDALLEGCHKCDIANISRRFVLWIGRRPRLDSDDYVIVVCLS